MTLRKFSLLLFCALMLSPALASQGFCQNSQSIQSVSKLAAGTILAPVLITNQKPSRWKPGGTIEAEFTRAVHAHDQAVVPAGTRIHLMVSAISKKKARRGFFRTLQQAVSLDWRRDISYDVQLSDATLLLPGGESAPIQVSFLGFGEQVHIISKTEAIRSTADAGKPRRYAKLLLEVRQSATLPWLAVRPAGLPRCASAEPVTIPAGMQARVSLAEPLSASNSKDGDLFRARLLEPIWSDMNLIAPEGSVVEGHVMRSKPPRSLRRGGSLRIAFERLILPEAKTIPLPASLGAMESEPAGVWIDSEGQIQGGNRTKKRAALDLGLAYVSGKIVDDLLEEGIKMSAGSAAAGSAAIAARYVGIGTGLVLFLLQHGRDVRLAKYAELELSITRNVVLSPGLPNSCAQ